MKILVMGAGKMGSFFIDLLSFEHEVAVFERDAKRMRFTYNCQRFTTFEEIQDFKPELLINAVTLKYTIPVFKEVIPYLPKECIISDIASLGCVTSVHTPCSDLRLPTYNSFPKRTPSSSARATIWVASSSRTSIRSWG